MEKDIGKIKKNDTSEIMIRIDDFGGRPGVTIREFVTSDRYTGFTKAGVRILAADFVKFREMINSVSLEDLEKEDGESETNSKASDTKAKPKKKAPAQEELPDY
jgi:hypothetical protein